MQMRESRTEKRGQVGGDLSRKPLRIRSLRIALALAALAVLSAMAGTAHTQSTPARPNHPILLPEANRTPDANDLMKMDEQNVRKAHFEAANAERKRQLDDESTKLLILARDLKAQMDKAGRDPLSPRLAREAEVIELLAHDVKEKMKMTVGGN